MSTEYHLNSVVPFADVDREQVILLSRLGQLLQEAAIQHADLYGVGAQGIAERGTSWVLHRLALAITRYPRRDEALRVQTWSTGVRGCKGYREFRLYSGEELLLAGSSLWLWIDLRARTLARVPVEIAECFPIGPTTSVHRPDLERQRYTPPAETAPGTEVSLRYADFDANGHVNNTAFFDFLQTALGQGGLPVHPLQVELQYLHEIPLGATAVRVQLEPGPEGIAFAIRGAGGNYAQGLVR